MLDHHIDQIPHELKQAHVHRGYRWGLTLQECFASIFMLHNDTINVWTHLLGACYFIASSPFIMSEMPANSTALDNVLMFTYILSAFTCHFLSAAYHTFRGSDLSTYKAFYRLDLTGIVILIAGSNFVGMYNAFIETSPLLVLVYLVPVSVLLSVAVYLTNAASCQGVEYDKVRVLTLAGSVAVGGVPIAHWLWAAQGDACFPYALWPVVGLGLSYATGFLIFYFRIPECFFPGRLDILASSHQFWHVLVFVAAYCWLHGMVSVFQCRIDGPSALSGLPELGA